MLRVLLTPIHRVFVYEIIQFHKQIMILLKFNNFIDFRLRLKYSNPIDFRQSKMKYC